MNKLYAALLAALMAVSCLALATAPTHATNLAPDQATKPERVLTERPPGEHQIDFRTFALKGRVEEPQADGTLLPYADRKVVLQKRSCKGCAWKSAKVLKTNDRGVYRPRIVAPRTGRWYWRVRIKASGGYAATTGTVWGTGNQRTG